MEQKTLNHGQGSVSWVIPILIALLITWDYIGKTFQDLAAQPVDWESVSQNLFQVGLFAIPFLIASLITWALRRKKVPAFAFSMILMIGVFFFLFSLVEAIGGFASRPIVWTAAAGGLMQIAVIALPFFTVAWLLWFRPKIGAIILICLGVALAFLFRIDIKDLMDPIMAVLVGLPVVLGIYTLCWAIVTGKARAKLREAG